MARNRFETSEAYLAAIVESSDDAIISKDLNGIVQSFNPAAERMFGYAADEIIGRPVTTLVPPDRLHEEERILATLRRGERVDHQETVRMARDGRRIDVVLSVSPVRDGQGRIVGASKILRDVTERKRAAAALAAQQQWFRVTLGSIGDAVIACDASGFVTYMNAVAESLTGWTSADAFGRPMAEVFHIVNEETRVRVENPAEKVLRDHVTVGLANHTVLIAKDGKQYPIDDSAAPIFDLEGEVIGVVLVFHDVTERRRTEKALKEQREWLTTTLASIGDGVIATDVRGDVVFMNRVAEHLTGFEAATAHGKPCNEIFRIVDETTRRPVRSPVAKVLAEKQIAKLSNHTVLLAADGTERAIDDSGAPIWDGAGNLSGVVLVFRDITERRRAEIERQTAAAEREELLTSERKARADAERADRVKDEFVAMVSHELRTPLSAILGWVEVLRRKSDDAALVRHGLEIIDRNARTQSQLVSDLLDVSRIMSGKLLLAPEAVELHNLVRECVDAMHPSAQARELEIRAQIDPVPQTIADPARLRQVVLNLLSNSVKFTPKGGHIDVRLKSADGTAEIVVRDSGVGIRPEEIPGLFQRFYQSGPSTTRRFAGLGLGLSIAKHLVSLHGGNIHAASEGEGKGATFTVSLPLTQPVTDRRVARAAGGDRAERISLEGLTVLIVEDEQDMRDMVAFVLAEHGARLLTAASAAEALELLEQVPDVLVSDIRLPEMSGYELVQSIRRRKDAVGDVPAVALTAFARSEDRMRALRAGFQAHLAKPFEHGELVATVASLAGITQRRPVAGG